jgi:hypothetical protein
MISASLGERAVLDELEPSWRKRGYTLIRQPSQDQLPGFLKGFRPDAIAVGAKPGLVIEVVQTQSGSSETKIRQLRGLFKDNSDWRLEVVYLSQDGVPLKTVTSDDIQETLEKVRLVAESEPRAALLMSWATLEAIARKLEPELASRSLSPRSLVDVLVSNGHLPQSETAKLRRLGDARNALAHGQINNSPKSADIQYLIDLAEELVA